MKIIQFFILNQILSQRLQIINKTCNWQHWDFFFQKVKTLRVTVLPKSNPQFEIADFTDNYIKEISAKNLQRSVIIQNTEPADGEVVIAWDEEQLLTSLDRMVLEPKARVPFALIFIKHDCRNVTSDAIMRRFWQYYHVFMIISWYLCDCSKIHFYDPFAKSGDSWGTTRDEFVDEISEEILSAQYLENLKNFPLNISIFERDPTVIRSTSNYFSGLDGNLLKTLSEYLKFQIFLNKGDNQKFGRVYSNGTITGALGDIVNQRAHLSANGRFLADYGTRNVEFTVPYASDQICMVVPKALKIPHWIALFKCFDWIIWIVIFLVYIICAVFWYLLEPSRAVIWEVYAMFMGIPIKLEPTFGQFFFLSSCMFFSITILKIIEGSFFTAFTTTSYYRDIKTLEELVYSDLPIASNMWFLGQFDNSDLYKKLSLHQIGRSGDIYDLIAYGRKTATLDRRLDLELLLKTKYVSNEGNPLMHIVDECLMSFFIVYIVPKGSPFLDFFNRGIMRLFEGGFTRKWYNDVVHYRILQKMMNLKKEPAFNSFTLHDVKLAFFIMIFGNLCSGFIFICEIAVKKYFNKI